MTPRGAQEAPPILGLPCHGGVTGPYLSNPAGLTGRTQQMCDVLGSRRLFGGGGRTSQPTAALLVILTPDPYTHTHTSADVGEGTHTRLWLPVWPRQGRLLLGTFTRAGQEALGSRRSL